MSDAPARDIALIVAMARDGVIGRDNGLPWHLRADLQRFKALTMGHRIVMGRRTYDSIGRPLPGRDNVIVSRDKSIVIPGCAVVNSLAAALATSGRVFVIGGAQIYAQTLAQATQLFVTQVDAQVDGDTIFPDVDWETFALMDYARHGADEHNEFDYAFFDYARRD